MKIGIPRALLYYWFKDLWETFLQQLGINFVVSPETNGEILNKGMNCSVDETCLPSKIYLGHVEWLLDKCDCLLVPRICSWGRAGTMCTKFLAVYDLTANTFRERNIKLLNYNIDPNAGDGELTAFINLGTQLGKKKSHSLHAYLKAKGVQKNRQAVKLKTLEHKLNTLSPNSIKILVVSHPYVVCDNYLGKPIIDRLYKLGTVPIVTDMAPKKATIARSSEISETLPWAFNKELVGSIALYKNNVDGIIIISAFPCGPDSLVNEMIVRKIKDTPILTLVIDGQDGMAGLETRLESFVDILKFKKDVVHGTG